MAFFWFLEQCRLVGRWQSFEATVSIFRAELAMLGSSGIYTGLGRMRDWAEHRHLSLEDGSNIFLRIVDIYRQVYKAPKSGRKLSSAENLILKTERI
jgi:hypothetical protein